MRGTESVRRDDAARLLGISADADDATVRRAFRTWAALAHPDHGGDAGAFADLCEARDLLLRRPSAPRGEQQDPRPRKPDSPRPRKPWSEVLVRPSAGIMLLLAVAGALAVASVIVGRAVPMPWGVAAPACAAAAWCVALSASVLRGPDHGHVIVARSLAWGAVVLAQLALAALLGIPALEVLPVIALPFVAVIAAVNPGAGLWRTSRLG